MSSISDSSILVVGAGVIGLTTAIRLAEAGHDVAVVAQETPRSIFLDDSARQKGTYTSSGSGGLWMPFLLEGEKIEKWATTTYQEYEKRGEDVGITFHEGFFLCAKENPELPWYTELTNLKVKTNEDDERIPKEYTAALNFKAPVVNTAIYLLHLQDCAESLGVSITLTKELKDEDDEDDDEHLWDMECIRTYTGPETIVVVCTGVGSSLICPTEKLIPGRGITVRIRKPGDKDYFITESPLDGIVGSYDEGLLAYCIPKGKDLYTLGGTFFKGDWKEYALEEEVEGVIQRACKILQVDEKEVVVDTTWTGLRPITESGQAKVEIVEDQIIANFGHGGSGLTVCWGCAEEVCDIVKEMKAEK